jgi:basic membrane protein A
MRLGTGLSTIIHILLAASLVACVQRDHARAPASSGAPGFRVALLTPGPISDQSWNGGAYQGLIRVRDSLGASVSHVQTKTPAEFEEQFRQYGAQGYDLVIGHGFEFQDAAKRVGPEFPHTVYITTSGTTYGGNVAGIAFAFADASYLAGLVAGAMSTSGTIGVIGGTELPPVKESFAAFARGAKAARPSVKILTSYIGNWDDVSAGKEQALAQIERGADIIFQNADAAGLGVFQAARESKRALVIGSNANQNGVAPEVTIGSVMIDLPHAFLTVAKEVKEGRFQARVIELGTKEDVITLVLNPAMKKRIPPATLHLVDSLGKEMHAGRFNEPAGAAR